MLNRGIISALFLAAGLSGAIGHAQDSLRLPAEKHLRNIRQLTFGGENAEAYFSFAFDKLVFQSTRDSFECDQIYSMGLDGKNLKLLSTGRGRTTCSFFLPGDSTIIYATTQMHDPQCPPRPDYSKGYIWAVYKSYDIVLATAGGSILRPLTTTEGYDAEATVSPAGDRIVFTSFRDGDLELYSMKTDGSDVRRLTGELGYDGGAFYSPDGRQIVYRSHHPTDSAGIAEYKALLNDGFVRPTTMEICTMNADGSNKRVLTRLGAASFAPFYHPDGKHIIFASNHKDPKGRNFDLFMISTDGEGLEQITFNDTFDGFPMFDKSGSHLVFASNRHSSKKGETNIFIAEWVP